MPVLNVADYNFIVLIDTNVWYVLLMLYAYAPISLYKANNIWVFLYFAKCIWLHDGVISIFNPEKHLSEVSFGKLKF